ncbi:MAG: hypothetical protein ACYCSI_04965 [Solirubrobacteraceae bacterium]
MRLAEALNKLECRLVTDPADTASWVALSQGYFTPRTLLAVNIWNLATRHGLLDLTFPPSGFPAATVTWRRARPACPQRGPR